MNRFYLGGEKWGNMILALLMQRPFLGGDTSHSRIRIKLGMVGTDIQLAGDEGMQIGLRSSWSGGARDWIMQGHCLQWIWMPWTSPPGHRVSLCSPMPHSVLGFMGRSTAKKTFCKWTPLLLLSRTWKAYCLPLNCWAHHRWKCTLFLTPVLLAWNKIHTLSPAWLFLFFFSSWLLLRKRILCLCCCYSCFTTYFQEKELKIFLIKDWILV